MAKKINLKMESMNRELADSEYQLNLEKLRRKGKDDFSDAMFVLLALITAAAVVAGMFLLGGCSLRIDNYQPRYKHYDCSSVNDTVFAELKVMRKGQIEVADSAGGVNFKYMLWSGDGFACEVTDTTYDSIDLRQLYGNIWVKRLIYGMP